MTKEEIIGALFWAAAILISGLGNHFIDGL